jgi:membrane protein DedA with SNARE-associated domain
VIFQYWLLFGRWCVGLYTETTMAEAVINFISQHGYWGAFLLMFAENVFPPIPSEVVLPFIGHSVAKGEMNFTLALLVASIGSFLGTLFWFALGWFAPAAKLEKFFRKYGGYVAISGKDFHKATGFFVKYEVPAVFFGRMIPGVRSVISIPAGSVRMSFKKFVFYSLGGLIIWNTMLMSFGYFALNDYTVVEKYMQPIGDAIIYLFILVYVVQVVRFVLDKEGRA